MSSVLPAFRRKNGFVFTLLSCRFNQSKGLNVHVWVTGCENRGVHIFKPFRFTSFVVFWYGHNSKVSIRSKVTAKSLNTTTNGNFVFSII